MLAEVVVVARTADPTRFTTRDTVILFFFAFERIALVLGPTVLLGWVTGALAYSFTFPLAAFHVDFTEVLVATFFAQRFATGLGYTNTTFLEGGGRFAHFSTLTVGGGRGTRWTANAFGVLWIFLVTEELAFASSLASFAGFADVLARVFDAFAAKAQGAVGVFAVGVGAACGLHTLVLRVAFGANGVFAVGIGGTFHRLLLALAVFALFFLAAVRIRSTRLCLAFAVFAFRLGCVFAVAVALAFRLGSTFAVDVAFLVVFAITISLAFHCGRRLALC